MPQTLQTLDWIFLAGFFALVSGAGIFVSKYVKRTDDFFKGGGAIPWWMAGISCYVGYTSAFVFVVYGQMAYKHGLVALCAMPCGFFGFAFSAVFLAKRWRKAGILTPVEYLEMRYNNVIRQVFAIGTIPYRIIDDSLKVLALSILLSLVTGLSINWMVGIAGLLVLVYCTTGGLLSVVVTDTLQFLVMLAVVVWLFIAALASTHAPEFASSVNTGSAWSGLWASLRAQDNEVHFFASAATGGNITLSFWMILVLVVALSTNMWWSLIQRYLCVKSDHDAPKVAWTLAWLNVAMAILILVPVFIGRRLLPGQDDAESKSIYVRLCMLLLPSGTLGLVVAAMFAATTTSLAAEYTVLGSVMAHDIYRRMIHPQGSDGHYLTVARVCTGLTALVAISVCMIVLNSGATLFTWMAKATGLFLPPMAVPFIGGILWQKPSARAAIITYLVGLATAILLFGAEMLFQFKATLTPIVPALASFMERSPWVRFWEFHTFQVTTLAGFAVTISAFIASGHLCRPPADENARREALFQRLRGV